MPREEGSLEFQVVRNARTKKALVEKSEQIIPTVNMLKEMYGHAWDMVNHFFSQKNQIPPNIMLTDVGTCMDYLEQMLKRDADIYRTPIVSTGVIIDPLERRIMVPNEACIFDPENETSTDLKWSKELLEYALCGCAFEIAYLRERGEWGENYLLGSKALSDVGAVIDDFPIHIGMNVKKQCLPKLSKDAGIFLAEEIVNQWHNSPQDSTRIILASLYGAYGPRRLSVLDGFSLSVTHDTIQPVLVQKHPFFHHKSMTFYS